MLPEGEAMYYTINTTVCISPTRLEMYVQVVMSDSHQIF